jgi:pyruvate ferredoxin oxidoreductase alpha subunit
MKGLLLSATHAAAHGAKLAGVESVPHFPAPFSVEIAESIQKNHKCDVFELESAGSAFSAALGLSAAGKRAFVPCSSPSGSEVITAPFMRLPFIADVSRSGMNKSDHSAMMALRDAGYLMFFPESNQEIYDTVINAYRVSEDPKVLLPAMINIDGLPNFSEPVVPVGDAKGFLMKPPRRLDVKKPAAIDIFADNYEQLKMQQHKAMENALDIIAKTDEKWKQKSRRSYGLVEKFMLDDAETVIVVMGYHSATAKAAAKKMRANGKKVGVLRIRVFRPWPRAQVEEALKSAKRVIVFDQSISIGAGSIIAAHIRRQTQSAICLGKYPSEKDFADVVARSEKDASIMWL